MPARPIRSCCQPPSSLTTGGKRKQRPSPSPTPPPTTKHRGPSLPPIHTSITPISPSSLPASPTIVPEFPTMPPLSSIAALAGSGCSCGFRCTCPGCVEHRGSKYASKDHGDCPDGCGTCVDYEGGVELPMVHSHHCTAGPSQSTSRVACVGTSIGSSGASFVDSFFARATSIALPPAPAQRKRRGTLDPTDTTVYPSTLFACGPRHLEERGPAFGLVSVPKLQCCAGNCGCPDGSCGCDHSCGGCVGDTHAETHQSPILAPTARRPMHGGCCSGS